MKTLNTDQENPEKENFEILQFKSFRTYSDLMSKNLSIVEIECMIQDTLDPEMYSMVLYNSAKKDMQIIKYTDIVEYP